MMEGFCFVSDFKFVHSEELNSSVTSSRGKRREGQITTRWWGWSRTQLPEAPTSHNPMMLCWNESQRGSRGSGGGLGDQLGEANRPCPPFFCPFKVCLSGRSWWCWSAAAGRLPRSTRDAPPGLLGGPSGPSTGPEKVMRWYARLEQQDTGCTLWKIHSQLLKLTLCFYL